MTRITIELADEVAKLVADAAADRGLAPEDVVAEAVSERFSPRRTLGFIGLGHSGRGDLSGRVKELRQELAAERLQEKAEDGTSGEG